MTLEQWAQAQKQVDVDQQSGWGSGSQGCGTNEAQGGISGNYQECQQHVCPACGYCPCCGRRNPEPTPYYPPGPGYPSPYIGDPIPFWKPYTPVYTCGTQAYNGPQVQSYN